MAIYGGFASPILGMLTQSASFGAISQNISNINTGGYKATDTRFSTVLASQFDNNSDIGGVRAIRKVNVSGQGNTIASTLATDVAINGRGMIVLNSQLDGTGEQLYTRDGAFQLLKGPDVAVTGVFRDDGSLDVTGNTVGTPQTFNTQEAYLGDKNGLFVQGYLPNSNGVFPTTGPTAAIRIDRFAFISDASATSTASTAGNLPATDAPGTVQTMVASVIDAGGGTKTFNMQFTRGTAAQQWGLEIVPQNGTNTTVPTSETFTFGTDGTLPTGTAHAFTVDWADGQSSSISLDLGDVTSIGGPFLYTSFDKNGRVPGDLQSFSFDQEGHVNGLFSNGVTRALYKLPIATFINPDGLDVRQGNLFSESLDSGTVTLRGAGAGQFGEFIPFATELSNTNLQTEFSRMILAQQAYSLSGTVFKTVDEMTQQAANLKS